MRGKGFVPKPNTDLVSGISYTGPRPPFTIQAEELSEWKASRCGFSISRFLIENKKRSPNPGLLLEDSVYLFLIAT